MSLSFSVRRVAGYAEVALPDLVAGARHELVLEHADPQFSPRNRAWLPLGGYLRVGRDCLPLPPGTDLGLRDQEEPPTPKLEAGRLPLVPQPTDWHWSSHAHHLGLRPVAQGQAFDIF